MSRIWRVRFVAIALAVAIQPWLLCAQQTSNRQYPRDLPTFPAVGVEPAPATVPRTEASAQQVEVLNEYRKVLASEGVPSEEIERRMLIIRENGRRLEVELWNRVLTSEKPAFTCSPMPSWSG